MGDNLELDSAARAAVARVVASSASTPGSERFAEQLRVELANAGHVPPPEELEAIVDAIATGRFSQY
jgi:hypothetical protein